MRSGGFSPVVANVAQAITVGASPFTYQNTSGFTQLVMVSGGTVLTISYSTDGTTFYLVGLLAGQFTVAIGAYLRVTYVVVPTMTAINTTNF